MKPESFSQYHIFQLYAFTSMGVVILSTVVFILSTMPELTDEIDMILFTNTTDSDTGEVTHVPVQRWADVSCNYLLASFDSI